MRKKNKFNRNSPPDYKTDPLDLVLYLSWLALQATDFVEEPADNPNVKAVLEAFFAASSADLMPEPEPDALAEFRDTLIPGWME
ncbi:MAG: hypothetical protein V1848_04030 [Candidatus Magasanikbacteria bacterium]